MFSVILFKEDGMYDVVPSQWIVGEYVFWPNKNGPKKAKAAEIYDPLWPKYKFTLKREYGLLLYYIF